MRISVPKAVQISSTSLPQKENRASRKRDLSPSQRFFALTDQRFEFLFNIMN